MLDNTNKLRIAICDDEESVAKFLCKKVCNCLKLLGKEAQLDLFFSAQDFLSQAIFTNLVFLDVDMPEMNGIDAGRKINQVNPKCRIVIATASENSYKMAFHINALRYITKPFEDAEINEALEAYFALSDELSIEVSYERRKYRIYLKDILYIRAINGYSEIYSNGTFYRYEASLSAIPYISESKSFFRINRSNIVNFRKITRYEDNKVLIGEKEFTIPRREIQTFYSRYMIYLSEYEE